MFTRVYMRKMPRKNRTVENVVLNIVLKFFSNSYCSWWIVVFIVDNAVQIEIKYYIWFYV